MATDDGADASRILTEMSSFRDQLMARRSMIDAQIAGLEGAIGMVSGNLAVPTTFDDRRRQRQSGPGRPQGSSNSGKSSVSSVGRAGSLKQMIIRVLGSSSRAMSPKEIAAGVIRVGYKTKAANLTRAVSNALPLINQVKKAGHGLYQA